VRFKIICLQVILRRHLQVFAKMVKHLRKGDPCPTIPTDKLKFYSMHYCPFAQRVSLLISHYNQDHERIFIHLGDKPEWYLEKFPTGKVPALEKGDEKIVESDVICFHLDHQHGDQLKNVSGDEGIKTALECCGKVWGPLAGICFKGADQLAAFEAGLKEFEAVIKGPFISGDKVGMGDYLIYPVFERWECVYLLTKKPLPAPSSYPKIFSWIAAMHALPAVQKEGKVAAQHLKLFEASIKGEPGDYDV